MSFVSYHRIRKSFNFSINSKCCVAYLPHRPMLFLFGEPKKCSWIFGYFFLIITELKPHAWQIEKEEGETKNIVILFSFPFCFYLTYLGISNNFKATHKISIFWLSYRCDTFFTINPLFICKSTSLFSP